MKNDIVEFTARNGRRVIKTVTPSGVTGYVDASIPREALEGMRDALLEDLGLSLEEFRAGRRPD